MLLAENPGPMKPKIFEEYWVTTGVPSTVSVTTASLFGTATGIPVELMEVISFTYSTKNPPKSKPLLIWYFLFPERANSEEFSEFKEFNALAPEMLALIVPVPFGMIIIVNSPDLVGV